ncbi:hypothetical protein ACIRD2_17640 [Streptomyces sp. NPDC093595]|uniref:hypothetical protein n=1 Tax=Streptomyces sp. NPDC093595 TaxID=3366045 RepID=UPI00381D8DF5
MADPYPHAHPHHPPARPPAASPAYSSLPPSARPPGGPGRPAPETAPAPGHPRRTGASFAVVNGGVFAVHVLLACLAPGLMATGLWGATTVGVAALLLQVSLLLWTAVRYDR